MLRKLSDGRLQALKVLLFGMGVGLFVTLLNEQWNLVNRTYLSENALQPTIATPNFSHDDLKYAQQLTEQYHHKISSIKEPELLQEVTIDWTCSQLHRTALPYSLHNFSLPLYDDYRVHGTNIVALLRAPKTSGREAIVLMTRSFAHHAGLETVFPNSISSAAMSIALVRSLQSAKWMSKDVLLVITDHRFGDSSASKWLEDYHAADFEKQGLNLGMLRSGRIRAGLVLDFYASSFDQLVLSPFGANGKLPNLDLINAINSVSSYQERQRPTLIDTSDSVCLWFFTHLNGWFNHDYITTFFFMLKQALGYPSGDHSHFRYYNIDALTLRVNSRHLNNPGSFQSLGRIVEGTVRSISNLMEHFHQSFYFYVLPNTYQYVSIGNYMIPFALMLIPIALEVLKALLNHKLRTIHITLGFFRLMGLEAVGLGLYIWTITFGFLMRDWQILYSLVFFYVVAAINTRINHQFCKQIILQALVRHGLLSPAEVAEVKAHHKTSSGSTICGGDASTCAESHTRSKFITSLLPLLLFLGVFGLVNFSFCALAAAITIPLFCLFEVPAISHPASRFLNTLHFLLMVALSLPAICLLSHVYFGLPLELIVSSFQTFVAQSFQYHSLLVPFLCFIYFPLNVSHLLLYFDV